MKKTFAVLLLLSIVLLPGCFGLFKKKAEQKPAASEEPAAMTAPSSETQNGQAMIPEPPSFQDGDYYLQALSSRSLETCDKIRNEKLKLKCQEDVQKVSGT